MLEAVFNTTQRLIGEGRLLAGHDISDGGIVTSEWRCSFVACLRQRGHQHEEGHLATADCVGICCLLWSDLPPMAHVCHCGY